MTLVFGLVATEETQSELATAIHLLFSARLSGMQCRLAAGGIDEEGSDDSHDLKKKV